MAAGVGSSVGQLFIEGLSLDSTGPIQLMLCRMWDVNATSGRYLSLDFIFSDAKGNAIHCTAKSTVAHNFLLRLKEGFVYSVRNYVVLPNKEEYRLRKDDPYMLEFDGATVIKKIAVNTDGFDRHPLQLIDLESVEPTESKHLIDVAGYATNIGRTNHTKTGAKNLDFYLADKSGHSIRMTLWGGLGDTLIEKKTKHVGLCPIVLTSASAKYYNNKLYLSSSSSTVILDDVTIPAIKDLRDGRSAVVSGKVVFRVEESAPRDGTLENLLLWARNKKNDGATFNCKITIDNVRTRKGWSFPACGGAECKKSATRKGGQYWCDSCEKTVPYPVMKYRLELGVSDGTAATVVTLFDEAAMELVKVPASALQEAEDETLDGAAGLPPALANLIGQTHIFELRSQSYYEYGTFESFTCWKIRPDDGNVESASSSTAPPLVEASSTSLKRLRKEPSVATPSKPAEEYKKTIEVLEDSDVEAEYDSLGGSNVLKESEFSSKKKYKKYTAMSENATKRRVLLSYADVDEDPKVQERPNKNGKAHSS